MRALRFSCCLKGPPRPIIAATGGTLSRLSQFQSFWARQLEHYDWLPLLPIIVLGFVLRVLWIDRQSLWYDELFTVWVSRLPLHDLLPAVAADSQTPWLPYVLLHWWPGLWGAEFALRLYAVVPGTLAIPAVWRLARVYVRPAQAHLAALLMATSPFLISRSQEVRGYTWYLLFGVLASLCFLRLSRGDWGSRLGYVAFLPLTLLTHYYGVFLLLSHGLTWRGWPQVRRLRVWPLAASAALGLLLWWSAAVVASAGFSVPARPALPPTVGVGRPTSQWSNVVQEARALLAQAPSSIPAVSLITKGTSGTSKPSTWKRLSGRTAFEVASQLSLGGEFGAGIAARPTWWNVLAVVYLVIAAGAVLLGWRQPGVIPLLTWTLVPAVAVYLIDRVTAMGFEARYLILVAPFSFVLISMGLSRRAWLVLGGACLLLMHGVGVWMYFHSPYDARDDWRALISTLQAEQQPGDGLFAFPAHHFAMASAVYAPNLPEGGGWVWPDGQLILLPEGMRWRGYGMRLAAVAPGNESMQKLMSLACEYDRLWVVTYASRVDGDSSHILQQLDDDLDLLETHEFRGPKGLRLWLFNGCSHS